MNAYWVKWDGLLGAHLSSSCCLQLKEKTGSLKHWWNTLLRTARHSEMSSASIVAAQLIGGKAQGSDPNSGLNGNNVESKEGFKSSDPFHWNFSESFGGPLFKMKISGRVMDGRKRGSSSSVDTFLDPTSLFERMRVESEKVMKLRSLCL